VYRGGKNKEAELLGSCYTTCLDLARQKGVHTISFPSISTGVYGYPVKEAAAVALDAIVGYLREKPDPPLEIKLVQFSESDHEVYRHEGRRFEFAQS
jgi:O-acetyl-ADP-ribose deacetylase (regulator of RNase III)